MSSPSNSDYCQRARLSIERILLASQKTPPSTAYPPLSSIPRTTPERLALASPDNQASPDEIDTVLYLAYGSNLSAEIFLGNRGIRPLSSINVSAPALDLTFDLPGVPYNEPCFANVAPRKLPKPPVPLPPGDPTKPPIQLPPPATPSAQFTEYADTDRGVDDAELALPALPPGRGPTWSKGLVGVVYEVTRADYAQIVKTEGGGRSYQDVLTPCLTIPPAFHVPEQPPLPDLKPFIAHTLYAPRLPADPPTEHWWEKLLIPVRRPDPGYAQPSPRYLKLLRDGAAEHYLPHEYQEYLGALEAYVITTRRQQVGSWLLMLLWMPPFIVFVGLSRMLADDEGRIPQWLAMSLGVVFKLMWLSYDNYFKKWFGDGERTGNGEDNAARYFWRKKNPWSRRSDLGLDEKGRLLGDR